MQLRGAPIALPGIFSLKGVEVLQIAPASTRYRYNSCEGGDLTEEGVTNGTGFRQKPEPG